MRYVGQCSLKYFEMENWRRATFFILNIERPWETQCTLLTLLRNLRGKTPHCLQGKVSSGAVAGLVVVVGSWFPLWRCCAPSGWPLLWFSPLAMFDPFVTPWTVAHQAPLSMGFPRQEYWSGLPFPPPGDLPDPGIEPGSPALAGRNLGTDIVISLRLLEYSYLFLIYPMKRH